MNVGIELLLKLFVIVLLNGLSSDQTSCPCSAN